MKSKIFLLSIPTTCIAFFLFFYPKKKEDKKVQIESASEALDALQFFSASRSYPYSDIPKDAYSNAYKAFITKFKTNVTKSSSDGIWKNIGPDNIGGRTLSIAINPTNSNIIWAGSASGGLWKSTTGGIGVDAWDRVPLGFSALAISSILIDPVNPNIMYLGTGETYYYGDATSGLSNRTTRGCYGIGILKSIDGGVTWTQSLNWSLNQQRGVWEVICNPKNTSVLYAATTEGIYKSNDAGGTWNQVLNQTMVMDIEIDRIDTNIVFAGVGNLGSVNKGVYRTVNSGDTWNRLTNGLPPGTNDGRISITTFHQNPKIVMANIMSFNSTTMGLYRSEDGGGSWTYETGSSPSLGSSVGWYSKCLLIDQQDSSKVLVGAVDLYKSLNKGANPITKTSHNSIYQGDVPAGTAEGLSDYMHPDIHDVVVDPQDPNKLYFATDGGVFRSDDFGETFYGCNGGYITSQFYKGTSSLIDSTLALGGLQDNGTVKYTGQSSWYKALTGDGTFNAIHPTNENIMYTARQRIHIHKSTSQGTINSWPEIYDGQDSAGAGFIAPFVMCHSAPNILYGGGVIVSKTTNNGGTWDTVGPALIDGGNAIISMAVSRNSPDTIYCGTAPTVDSMGFFRSFDGGTTWTNISVGLPNRYPRDIAISPVNNKELYVVFSGFGNSHIYKSTDAGNTWQDINNGLVDIPFHTVAIDPSFPSHIYVGTEFNVFASEDGGATWSDFSQGMPEVVQVFDLDVSTPNRKLRAYTHGNGVYERSLIGDATGISDYQKNGLTLGKAYPNPSKDILNINFSAIDKEENAVIKIFNINGILVRKENLVINYGENNIRINTEELNPGAFFYEILYHNKVYTDKFVIIK